MCDESESQALALVEVSVRWKSSRVAFALHRSGQALVSSHFMQKLTLVNSIINYGNPFIPPTPPSSSSKKRQLVQEQAKPPAPLPAPSLCSLTLPPASSLKSPYLPSLSAGSSVARVLGRLESCEMDVACAFDFWLWVERLGLFSPLTPPAQCAALSLLDTGFESYASAWQTPLEKIAPEQLEQLLSGDNTDNEVFDEELTHPPWNTVESYVSTRRKEMEEDSLATKLRINTILCRIRKEYVDKKEFWQDVLRQASEKEKLRSLSKRLETMKRKKSKK